MRLKRTAILCFIAAIAVLVVGCKESDFDETQLYKGMDRSGIIARFGPPDARRSHGDAERLTYRDGEKFQYLLLLIDDKLVAWDHDRVYKTGRFTVFQGDGKSGGADR
jgi:hypothetical protein